MKMKKKVLRERRREAEKVNAEPVVEVKKKKASKKKEG